MELDLTLVKPLLAFLLSGAIAWVLTRCACSLVPIGGFFLGIWIFPLLIIFLCTLIGIFVWLSDAPLHYNGPDPLHGMFPRLLGGWIFGGILGFVRNQK